MQRLTHNEIVLIHLIAEGLADADVARTCGTSVHTVKNQLQVVYRKLEIPGKGRGSKRIRLGVWFNYELFKIGLHEMQAA